MHLFQRGHETRKYQKIQTKGKIQVEEILGRKVLNVSSEVLTDLTQAAFHDVMHFLRASHLNQLKKILLDSESSSNDRFVAKALLENAVIAAQGVFPGCQDTGTAIIMGKKGEQIWVDGEDEAALTKGVVEAYKHNNFRYSQVAPLNMYTEKNTGNNLPAQIDIFSEKGEEYHFLFMAKGGGSANKSLLFQQTKALLNPKSMMEFLESKVRYLGTAACPPYHLAIVIGGLSAEMTLKTVKLASAGYYDGLPTAGDESGRAFRDIELEEQVLKMTQKLGIGAQFGGKYFCHDVRVIRLPRHGASCPVGIGVSCSADRQILGKITAEGVFLEELEKNPAAYLVDTDVPSSKENVGIGLNQSKKISDSASDVVKINLDLGMEALRTTLTQLPIRTRVELNGKLIVARDIAHAKIKERLDRGEGLPEYIKNHVVYYAGPAKTPNGYASGSFGPTTAQRMDPYIPIFQKEGGSLVTLAKGNRTSMVTESCKKYGGFYLGSIGGPAAQLGKNCITEVRVLEYSELGMEAVFEITVKNFPAFIVVDDKGNDFFADFREVE